MKQLRFKFYALTLVTAIAVLTSCHKDKNDPAPSVQTAGFYILNQGSFNGNNSTLSYYDYSTSKVTADQFSAANGRKLGDTGNDLKVYGSKMYITVNVSSTVEIVDVKTAKSLKQLSFLNNGVGRQPRSLAFYKGNAFVSSYDGTVAVIDTATMAVTKYITVGRNPEQMVVSNGKLYVANSGGLSFGNPDKTVSVIDLNTLAETKKITVTANPINMGADAFGHVYVLSAGDYAAIQPGMTIIDNNTDAVISQNATAGGYGTSIISNGDNLYFLTADNKVEVYNAKTQTISSKNFITDGTTITAALNLAYNIVTGELFVTDAKDYVSSGVVYAFDKNGKKEYSITAGINPGAVAFLNK